MGRQPTAQAHRLDLRSVVLSVAAVLAVVVSLLASAGRTEAAMPEATPSSAPAYDAKVAAATGVLTVRLRGPRLGLKARVTITGAQASNRGLTWTRSVKAVWRVANLPAGRYRVSAQTLTKGRQIAEAKPRAHRVRANRRSTVQIRYEAQSVGNWSSVSAGKQHVCAIDTSRRAWCWGRGGQGELGNNKTTAVQKRPVRVVGGHRFTRIAAGGLHTCALDAGGKAWCWGNDRHRQLGSANEVPFAKTPVRVQGGHTFTAIVAGDWHSCGLDVAGRAWCWGDNRWGAIGAGGSASATPVAAPRLVAGLHLFEQISANGSNTCGIVGGGSSWCWGRNNFGQAGVGSKKAVISRPQLIPRVPKFAAIEAGHCGVGVHGSTWCWGKNTRGAMGIGKAGRVNKVYRVPQSVTGLPAQRQIGGDTVRACTVDAAGVAWCWGDRDTGDGTDRVRWVPVRVKAGVEFTRISVGRDHACALSDQHAIWCWGNNRFGQLGNGTTNNALVPVRIAAGS